jgi:hypothetical protein
MYVGERDGMKKVAVICIAAVVVMSAGLAKLTLSSDPIEHALELLSRYPLIDGLVTSI